MNIKENILLSSLTTYKIGGPADFYIEANSQEELESAVLYALDHKLPYIIIGGGSNLLFDDLGIRGLAIKNNSCNIDFLLQNEEHIKEQSVIYADSGIELKILLEKCADHGLCGLEFLAGIPGSLGGAIYGNAGAYGKSISQYIKSITVLSDGVRKMVAPESAVFSYRHSNFKIKSDIILGAELILSKGEKKLINIEIQNNILARKEKHPSSHLGSCGCFFKNAEDKNSQRKISAGKLIEDSGGRGLKIGSAAVYEHHCNFILNYGGAKSKEILELASVLKDRVLKQTGICLENEVQIILPDPPLKSIVI